MTPEEIETRVTYHAPTPEQVEIYTRIRSKAREFALELHELLPECREKELALGHLLDGVVMHANAAIARRT